MKKLSIISIVIIACSISGFAQDELSVAAGAAIPTGDFVDVVNGLRPRTGVMIDLMYQHQLQENSQWWIAGELRYQLHATDMPPGGSGTGWSILSALIGPVMKVNLTDNLSLEPRLMIGNISVKSPGFSSSNVGATSTTGRGFGILAGANFKYKLSGKTKLLLGADYLTGKPDLGSGWRLHFNSLNIMSGMAFSLH